MAKVLDSEDPNFKEGDLIWGMTGWEQYSIINETESLFKIHDTDVPLSYYTGILGKFFFPYLKIMYFFFSIEQCSLLFMKKIPKKKKKKNYK